MGIKITFSIKSYKTKPTDYSKIHLKKEQVEKLENFYDKVRSGYGFCSNFMDQDEEFGFSRKTTSNFDYTNLVTIDIDEEKSISPCEFYYRLPNEHKPTYI